MNRLIFWVGVACALVALDLRAAGLSIAHDPVPFAVRGQPLTLKTKVTGPEAPQSVLLYYALFKDAAPFRVPMKSTGLDYYVGTIDASLVAGVNSFSYYIEAQDASGAITETPWYDVEFRRSEAKPALVLPSPSPAGPAAPAPVISAPDGAAGAQEKSGSWKKTALIAGGVALLAGGGYALYENNQSDDDDGDGGNNGGGATTNNPKGTYSGTVTTCLSITGGVAACESDAMSILIDVNNIVFSETIDPGRQLTANLNGSSFNLVSTRSGGGTNSTVNFEGSVVGNKILGSVSGTASTPSGDGVYSGSFSATRQ